MLPEQISQSVRVLLFLLSREYSSLPSGRPGGGAGGAAGGGLGEILPSRSVSPLRPPSQPSRTRQQQTGNGGLTGRAGKTAGRAERAGSAVRVERAGLR